MAISERLSMVVSLTLIGLALFFIIDLPPRALAISWGSLSFTLTASSRALMAILVGGLTFSGTGAVLHAHPHRRMGYTVPFWVNATLLAIFATLVLGRLGSPQAWAIGLLVTGGLLWVTILSEYQLVDATESRAATLAAWWSQAMSYVLLLGFALFISLSPMNVTVKIILFTLIAGLCAASILRVNAPTGAKYSHFTWVVMLAIAQLSALLMFLPLPPTRQALLILVAFYVFTGVAISRLQQRISRRTLLEYGALAGIGLAIIGWVGR